LLTYTRLPTEGVRIGQARLHDSHRLPHRVPHAVHRQLAEHPACLDVARTRPACAPPYRFRFGVHDCSAGTLLLLQSQYRAPVFMQFNYSFVDMYRGAWARYGLFDCGANKGT